MEWSLINPSDFGLLEECLIIRNRFGGWHLCIKYRWDSHAKAYDGYNFKTDTASKSYFAKNWKSKEGIKPKWQKISSPKAD